MLAARTSKILRHIVEQYIDKAVPVPSASLARDLEVSPATIRNEMALLEQEGLIFRPHTSAGSVPSDKGYRCYVESLQGITLSVGEKRLIAHQFHQVESEMDGWLGLAATLLAQLSRNVAVVSMPRSVDCRFKHIELVALQDSLVLMVLVLMGARVKEKLIELESPLAQSKLSAIANKLNDLYSGLTLNQIKARKTTLTAFEQQFNEHIAKTMQVEDQQEFEDTLLDGLHFILSQPEFKNSDQMRPLMELVEYRRLMKSIVPQGLSEFGVKVVIGKENREEAIQNYSVVISRYGLPDEATGTIGVVGPTRMSYARAISTVGYMSAVLSELMAGLYGRQLPRSERASN